MPCDGLSVCLFVSLCAYVFVCLSCLFVRPSVSLSGCLSVGLHVGLSVGLWRCLGIRLSVCLSVFLTVYLSDSFLEHQMLPGLHFGDCFSGCRSVV